MWTENNMIEYLKKNLKEKRVIHSIGVMETAVELAKKYGEDMQKAKIAGLLHDCGKNLSDEMIIDIIEKNGDEVDEITKMRPQIMHGKAGAYIAKNKMNVEENYIIDAIKYHTTGRVNMTLLDKIIFIADYIEPNRDFPGVDELREMAFEDIDKAVLLAYNNTLTYIIKNNEFIHLDTIKARNYLLK